MTIFQMFRFSPPANCRPRNEIFSACLLEIDTRLINETTLLAKNNYLGALPSAADGAGRIGHVL